MNYQDIAKVNSEMSTIDLKGKNYAMVPDRVNAFRKLYPEGFIRTEIVEHDGTTVTMMSQVGYYKEDGTPVVLGSGFAQEVRGKGLVNGTSYIENCETSAVGRALGMMGLGIGGGGICSAEELVNAITAQKQMEAEKPKEPVKFGPRKEPKAQVETSAAVPGISAEMAFLQAELGRMAEENKSTMPAMKTLFEICRKAAVKNGVVPDKKITEYTMDEVKTALEYMRTETAK